MFEMDFHILYSASKNSLHLKTTSSKTIIIREISCYEVLFSFLLIIASLNVISTNKFLKKLCNSLVRYFYINVLPFILLLWSNNLKTTLIPEIIWRDDFQSYILIKKYYAIFRFNSIFPNHQKLSLLKVIINLLLKHFLKYLSNKVSIPYCQHNL